MAWSLSNDLFCVIKFDDIEKACPDHSNGLAHQNTEIIVSMKITKPYTYEFLVNSLTFAICIFWYHLMQINLPMIILGQMIVFCNWFHWKFNNFTQKISTFIPICFEKLFALFASICLRTILFAEKCKQFLFANNLQSILLILFMLPKICQYFSIYVPLLK